MFERFTDRARRVLVLAQEESRLLNHSFIGTEHVLLGLIHEGEGVAARVLEELNVTLEAAREQVEETIGLSVTPPSGSPPFTPRAKKVLELSLREALQLGHNFIGTEHLLLGLVREGEGVAAQVLVSLGADLARVRQLVIQQVSGGEDDEAVGGAAPWPRVRPGNVVRGRWSSVAPGHRASAAACSFCGRDLWEVGRHVSTLDAVICQECLVTATRLVEQGTTSESGEAYFPPRLFGTAPDDDAPTQVVAAFTSTFGPVGDAPRSFEDVETLLPHLIEAGRRHPRPPRPPRVTRLRFLDDDTAQVEFALGLAQGPPFVSTGRAVRHDGRWFVSRDTVVRVISAAGVVLPAPEPDG